MNKTEEQLMTLGRYLFNFLMNEDYKKEELNNGATIYKAMEYSDELPMCKNYIEIYSGASKNSFFRKDIINDFKNVAFEIFTFINKHVSKTDIPEENKNNIVNNQITIGHIHAYANLGREVLKHSVMGGKNTDNLKLEISKYLKFHDSAIDAEICLLLEKFSIDVVKNLLFEIFYVISSGSIVTSVYEYVERIRKMLGN